MRNQHARNAKGLHVQGLLRQIFWLRRQLLKDFIDSRWVDLRLTGTIAPQKPQLSPTQPMSAKCCLQRSPALQKEIAGAPQAGGSQAAIREVVYIRNSVSSENASGAFDYSEPGISF